MQASNPGIKEITFRGCQDGAEMDFLRFTREHTCSNCFPIKQFRCPPARRPLIAKTCRTNGRLHKSDVIVSIVHVALRMLTKSFVKAPQQLRPSSFIIYVTLVCHSQQLDVITTDSLSVFPWWAGGNYVLLLCAMLPAGSWSKCNP